MSSLETTTNRQALSKHVYTAMREYLESVKGSEPTNLYEFFLEEVEIPLLETVMEHTRGNQVRAAKMLGLSRGTLRKKLKQYFENRYFKIKQD